MKNNQISLASSLMGKLYPYQEEMFSSEANELIVNKSRQVGISYCVACWALIRATAKGKKQLIISPSLRQSKHMMEYIYGFLNKLRQTVDINIREETKTSLIFDNDGEIHSLPNSANTVRGFPADDIWIDEFAHFTCGTDKEIIEAITPSISRGGNICYISTPFGDQNLFYQYWHNRDGLKKILINWKDCPDFQEDHIQSIKDTLGEDAFQQEYNNQFLSDAEGQEFPMSLIGSCIDHDLEYGMLSKDSCYHGGADIGREHDLTALLVLEKTGDTYIIRHKEIMRQKPYSEQLDLFNYYLSNYVFDNFVIDESGIGHMLAEEIAKHHKIERITFNNENKQEIVGNLKKIMQEGRLKIPNDPMLIDSIRAIKRIYTSTNYLRFDSGRDSSIGHADLFWALALAVREDSNKTYFRMG